VQSGDRAARRDIKEMNRIDCSFFCRHKNDSIVLRKFVFIRIYS